MKTSMLFLFLFIATAAKSQLSTSPATETIRIDPSNSFGATTSGLFSEVNFIPLETTKESLFSRIAEMQVTDKYFIIYDHGGNAVLLFEKNGKFHSKIKLKDANASVLDGFSVNRMKNEIIVRTRQKGERFLIFDFNGKYLRSEKADSIPSYFILLDSGFVAHQNTYRDEQAYKKNSNFDLFISLGFNKVVKSELTYQIGGKDLDGFAFFTNPFNYSPQIKKYTYGKLEDYAIHLFDHHGILKTYKFLFPAEMSLPVSFLTDSSLIGKRHQYISENPAKIYKLNNNYFLDEYLLFQLETMGPRDRDRILVYNTEKKHVFSFGKIAPDSSSFFIPIVNRGSDILATDDKYLYTSISAPVLFKMNENRATKIPYNKTLEDFFSKDARMNNPVLIQLKFKPGL